MEIIVDGVTVAVIIGIVSALKLAGLPSRFAALTAVALGIVVKVAFPGTDSVPTALWIGIVTGLSAAGLYSGTKALAGK